MFLKGIKFMINIKQNQKRNYTIFNDDKKIVDIELLFSPVSNKFNKIIETIEDISNKLGTEFDVFFSNYILEYIDNDKDTSFLLNKIDDLKNIADKYIDSLNIQFTNYVNREKSSKNSIFFDEEEIEKLIKCSTYLKLYFVICQDSELKTPINCHKEIYNTLIKDISTEITFKLYRLVSGKTYKYNMSDKTMWDFLRLVHCKPTDMHVTAIFNLLMNNILVTCDTISNPIPYFNSVIDESIKWILNGVYKESVIYSDTINTEDIHTISGKDNLLSMSYNDTIGKLVLIASKHLEHVGIEDINLFNDIVSNLKNHSLIAHYITYPIISKIFNIPYRYFKPVQIEHSYMLNILLYHYLPSDFKNEMSLLCKLLLHYNTDKAVIKTTYKIKDTEYFFNTFQKFMTFKNYMYAYDFYSEIIGKLIRNKYNDFVNNKEYATLQNHKLEVDVINFYNNYFNDNYTDMFDSMKIEIEKHF